MRQTSFAEMHCSLARSLEVVGDWWTPLILRDVYLGIDRFADLAEDLGISRNLLTERLNGLVDDGVLRRERYRQRPPRDRYVLTESGRQLIPILVALTAWGDRWQPPDGGPPIRFEHRDHDAVPVVACGACGDAIVADELTARPGPGGRAAPGTMVLARRLATP
ncbi:winged helix-turn-helix transcriptional regulator [Actinocatenispora sera]|uniref:HxlR family transcriptional regulator n=1 Tax=Actinocatenispora sera TaxID=390989 RepID=A0A810KWS1_9ACTN|nr:helix-turn-helix domain-containing protein [Actinocatenispora sera]BCJ27347.1 HxlR family transcriptional regulator [Actinocatenispora sera]